ncbi:MAG: polysaccharide deacetylase family protein [Syntrophomonadaceae bacterium]|jgi:probable sporulation protein (polysaccharide deacetylase family)|nr:polysaccharide deacetylase family protein [Syntrophomonadaceae bacterium]
MRIYWVNRKRLWTISAALFSIIFTLLVLVSYYRWSGIEANANKEAIYQGNTGKKVVAICVNVDWGEEYIPAMLEEFKKAQAQVTFFVTGSWAEKNPELLKQMSEAGHSIQNHAYKHVHFSSLSDAEAQAQIKKAEAVIEKIIGKKTRFFAPPYGEQNDRLVKAAGEIGYELIMWSVDTIDWQKPSPQTIVKRVGNKVHNDAIILMHPTDPTLQALPDLLAYLQDQGYGMITIDSILVKTDVTS